MPRTANREPGERTLYYGDCLEVMQAWGDACVDLVYLDPPFNSNADYSVLFGRKNGTPAQVAAFTDTWKWDAVASERVARIVGAAARPEHRVVTALESLLGPSGMLAYLSYMAERLAEVRRVLKPTGSVLLHCDPTASHYLKLIMDALFRARQFRNEIVWKRTSSKKAGRKLGAVHDVVLFYAGGERATFNHVYCPHDEGYVKKFYRHGDEYGRYCADNLTAAGERQGVSGTPWRGIDPGAKGNHWRAPAAFPAHSGKPEGWEEWNTHQKLDHLDAVGLIQWPEKTGGVPRFKRYLSTTKGAVLTDVITDVPPLSAQAKERLGYPTQKPVALLKRLVAMASNPRRPRARPVLRLRDDGGGVAEAQAPMGRHRHLVVRLPPGARRAAEAAGGRRPTSRGSRQTSSPRRRSATQARGRSRRGRSRGYRALRRTSAPAATAASTGEDSPTTGSSCSRRSPAEGRSRCRSSGTSSTWWSGRRRR